MRCNDRRFVNVVSAGLPALVTSSKEDSLKKSTGVLSYYLNGLEKIFQDKDYQVTYVVDSKVKNKIVTNGFMVAQGIYAGGGVKVSPSETAHFGSSFNFSINSSSKIIKTIEAVIEMQKRKPDFVKTSMNSYSCSEVTITGKEAIPMKLDGEEYSASEVKFIKEKNTIKILIY